MRRSVILVSIIAIISPWLRVQPVSAITMGERMSGRILLQVERNGEAWYVYPKDKKRYFLGRPSDAFEIMRKLGKGITDADLAKIPVATSSATGDTALRQRLSGYILIQVQQQGQAWYVFPGNTKRYYLGRPTDAFSIMKSLGVGISDANIGQIPVGTLAGTVANTGITVTTRTVSTSRGSFTVKQMTFDRTTPGMRIMTDTGNASNCQTNCTALSLGTYVTRRAGVAGIHGSYFCPPEYSSCAGQTNFYYYPIFNSFTKTMINQDRVKFTPEPMIVFDTTNMPHWLDHSKDLDTVPEYEQRNGVTVQAIISNSPGLVKNGVNIVDPNKLDSKQATVKSSRGAIGWKGDTIYLFYASSATVTDLGAVATAMGLDYALNLDGGGSTALYHNGSYIIGPGRDLPNAIVIQK